MRQVPEIIRCTSVEEFKSFTLKRAQQVAKIEAFELGLLRGDDEFTVPGWCAICQRNVSFAVDYLYSDQTLDGLRIPNWRERLVCPNCHLNNRMRAAVGFLTAGRRKRDQIYLTESTSALFKIVLERRQNTIGSEYLRDGTKPGATNENGIRHEDATQLTFPDRTFHKIGSFDVLEHIPDYRRALAEFFRCLKPSGMLLITVPFALDSPTTITRAIVHPDGTIEHLLPPEIHGDPVSSDGALCFYHFGWDFLDTLRDAGFVDASLSFFWSPELGYLGGYQFVITARKPRRKLWSR